MLCFLRNISWSMTSQATRSDRDTRVYLGVNQHVDVASAQWFSNCIIVMFVKYFLYAISLDYPLGYL